MTGTFGTLTFDDGGIDNLYNGDYTSADVSYSTTVGAISLSVAHDTAELRKQILCQLDIQLAEWHSL